MASLTPEQSVWVERSAHKVGIIARVVHRMLSDVRVDELESAGYEGLIQAALRYDPESGVAFEAFAHYRIRGAMIDWVRSQNPGLRRHQRAVRSLEASQSLLEDAAADGGSDRRALEDRVAAARALVERTATAVMTSRAMDHEPDRLATETDPERSLIDSELRRRLDGALSKLEPGERELVEAIYQHGRSMQQLAQELGVATSTVSRRHAKLMARLAERLRG